MYTHEFCQQIKEAIPETRNQPDTMNTLMVHLREIDRILRRINEGSSSNTVVLEINFIAKDPKWEGITK